MPNEDEAMGNAREAANDDHASYGRRMRQGVYESSLGIAAAVMTETVKPPSRWTRFLARSWF